MLRIGMDLGTGFVKCVSDHGEIRFPSIYAKRVHGSWSGKATEAVGNEAARLIGTMGTSVIRPISRGRPDSRYPRQVEMLVQEAVDMIYRQADPAAKTEKVGIVVGLPYHAFESREATARVVKKMLNVGSCTVVSQACGTLVDTGRRSGIVVSIGQGTTEIIVIDNLEVIDGESSSWASDFVTQKLGKLAHLDMSLLHRNKDICRKYGKILAENLSREVGEAVRAYKGRYDICLSGGGLLLPGVHPYLTEYLKSAKVVVPKDPVMSNARGLYMMVPKA